MIRSPRAVLRMVLSLDGSPHAIALGTAIGVAIGMTPTVGIQMMLVMALAFVLSPVCRFNRVAAVGAVYVSNPVTVVPLYWFLYWVGTLFVGGHHTSDDFRRVLEFDGFSGWWQTVCYLGTEVGVPLGIGTAIVAPVCGLVTYPLMRVLIRWYRPAPNSSRAQRPRVARQTKQIAISKSKKLTLTES
ncbi:MAG: DUF2062 domain-containing protein [Planctomycetaceae bacterium]|nr:DUF2062 domain-containing protein [Planctomycetaceae bacterium]